MAPALDRANTTTESALVRLQQTLYTSRNPTRKWLHTSRYQWIHSAIKRYATPDGTALEVGPGSGIYLPALSKGFSSVTALDIEQDYLSGLAPVLEKHKNITTRIDDITGSTINDNSFDLVLCSEVLEHIPDAAKALAEINRITKPGGILILSTPQPYCPLELAAKIAFYPGIKQIVSLIYREPLLPLGHVNLVSGNTLRKQLTEAGFTIIESHTGGVYLPAVSEFFGERAVKFQKRLEKLLRGTALEFLLWTQYYVVRVAP